MLSQGKWQIESDSLPFFHLHKSFDSARKFLLDNLNVLDPTSNSKKNRMKKTILIFQFWFSLFIFSKWDDSHSFALISMQNTKGNHCRGRYLSEFGFCWGNTKMKSPPDAVFSNLDVLLRKHKGGITAGDEFSGILTFHQGNTKGCLGGFIFTKGNE